MSACVWLTCSGTVAYHISPATTGRGFEAATPSFDSQGRCEEGGSCPDTMVTSQIADFYQDRSVLITGATGFMGKVLVEKLLRSCSGVKTLYLLMRPKHGSDIRTRLEELISTKIFETMKHSHPELLTKLHPISGDITQPGLGIGASDLKLLIDNVSVVFHAAATVKFDDALKMSVSMNVQGTKRLLEICQQMENLVALIHVSTAYCNCDREDVNEIIYPPPIDPNKLIECCEWMDTDMLEAVTPKLIGNRPNTYTYTKALAESLLVEEAGKLPVTIVRPSIVTAAWREPIPGWVDNLNGPTGLLAGAGKGVLRTILCHKNAIADVVPVDIPINLMIAVAWHTATARPNSIMVYNCTSGKVNPLYWRDVEYWGNIHLVNNPMNDVLWYPGGSFKRNRMLNQICVLFQHYLPAYLMDLAAWLAGKKPIMVRIQNKMSRAMQCLEYFTTREWRFSDDNIHSLLTQLSPKDKELFNCDVSELYWPTYLEQYCMGTRQFVMKEDGSSLPAARKHVKRMYWVQRITKLMGFLVFWRMVMLRSQWASQLWLATFGMLVRLLRLVPFFNHL